MIIKCVPCAFYTLSYRSWVLCVPGMSILALLLRHISYKYNKRVSFFTEVALAPVLKVEGPICVSMIIDLTTAVEGKQACFCHKQTRVLLLLFKTHETGGSCNK